MPWDAATALTFCCCATHVGEDANAGHPGAGILSRTLVFGDIIQLSHGLRCAARLHGVGV
jgi:hypothetical protein